MFFYVLIAVPIFIILISLIIPLINSDLSNEGLIKGIITCVYSLVFIVLYIIFGRGAVGINAIIQLVAVAWCIIRPFIKKDLYQTESDINIILLLYSTLMLILEFIYVIIG